MGDDYAGPEKGKKGSVVGPWLMFALLQSSCVTQHAVTPYTPQNPTGNIPPHAAAKPSQAATTATPPNGRFQLTTQAVTAPWRADNSSTTLTGLRRNQLVQRLSRATTEAGAPSLIAGVSLLEAMQKPSLPYSDPNLWATPLVAPMEIPPSVDKPQAAPAPQPPPQKSLKDLVSPDLQKRIEARKKLTIETKPPNDVDNLRGRMHTFEKAEELFGVPAIFFATTLCRETTWGKDNKANPLQYFFDSFADQLREVGPDMLDRLSDDGKTPRNDKAGKPVMSTRAFEDTRYAVALMQEHDGTPTTPKQVKAVRTAKGHALSELGTISVYLQKYIDDISNRLFPDDKELAKQARNGILYAMYNFGAPAIDKMSKHLDAKVNQKYADGTKCALFGINPKTATNRSALMNVIADYEGYESGVKVLLAQKDLLPAQPLYGQATASRPPLVLAANNAPNNVRQNNL